MINIVVPMAGRGSRFRDAGYNAPKPLIDIYGHRMIEYVIKNITPKCDHRFIFICQKEHIQKYGLDKLLNKMSPNCCIIPINYITEGAACTVLLAEKEIDNDNPLMIANSDQFVDVDINKYLMKMEGYDGLIMTMPSVHPKWSYIAYTKKGDVTLVREKEVISDQATVGIYNYKRGKDFCKFAHEMINKDIRVNGEFYVAPVYNEIIESGMRVTFFDIGNKMHGIGTPEDLDAFKETGICKQYFNRI